MNKKKSVAVIGSGVAGIVSAYLLDKKYSVTLIEANDYLGGHTNTIEVNQADKTEYIDTGFIVFNKVNYPLFTSFLEKLNVSYQDFQYVLFLL